MVSGTVTEAPPNWLSDIINPIRERIHVLIERREIRFETEAIIVELRKHPKGQAIANKPDIQDVIGKALRKANEVEEEVQRTPDLMTGSPAVQASWVVFDHYGMERDN